tara:strand:+ start:6888 stop:7250 length:363 start_codon:yes stop_codon:yes gene_type:complete
MEELEVKLSKSILKKIINEELSNFLNEAHAGEKLADYWASRSPEEQEEEAGRLQRGVEKNMERWPAGDVRSEVEDLLAGLNEDKLQEVLDFVKDLTNAEEEVDETGYHPSFEKRRQSWGS